MEAPPVVDAPPARPAWWLRALGRLPLPLMYALAGFVAWLLRAVFRYRVRVVRDNLRGALPELEEGERQEVLRLGIGIGVDPRSGLVGRAAWKRLRHGDSSWPDRDPAGRMIQQRTHRDIGRAGGCDIYSRAD